MSFSAESGGRRVGENKALTAKKARLVTLKIFCYIIFTQHVLIIITDRFTPYTKFEKCKVCKQFVHQAGAHYCQSKGIV